MEGVYLEALLEDTCGSSLVFSAPRLGKYAPFMGSTGCQFVSYVHTPYPCRFLVFAVFSSRVRRSLVGPLFSWLRPFLTGFLGPFFLALPERGLVGVPAQV